MEENLRVEKLTQSHVNDVLEIEQSLLGTGVISDIEKTLSSDSLHYFVLLKNDEVIGFFESSIVAPEAELFDIAIKHEEQGKGYSKLLMRAFLEFVKSMGCDTIFLEVNRINVKAINLYEKFGFKKYAERKNYYGDNDAVLMKLENF